MSEEFQEYLELYEYFGRGGQPRLQRVEFLELHGEFEQLVALGPKWTAEQVARIVELRDALLRDRPRLRDLMRALGAPRG